MSGPKIVIVRSPAELQREREQRLRELRSIIREWQECIAKDAEKSSKLDDIDARLKPFADAFSVSHDLGIDKIVKEIEFLKGEIASVRAESVKKAAKRKQRTRSIEATARALLSDTTKLNTSSKSSLEYILNKAKSASDTDLNALDVELSNIVNGFLKVQEASAEYKVDKFTENLAKNIEAPSAYSPSQNQALEEKENRLDELLSELELIDDPSSAQILAERSKMIEAELQPSRKQLLLDSLLIDLSKQCRQRKTRHEAQRILAVLESELSSVEDSSCDSLRQKLDLALKNPELEAAQQLEKEVRACSKTAASRKDSLNKRNAILAGFASMGYEVREGMATGWARDGRIVLLKKETPELGVEIGSTETVDRIQVRVVGVPKDGATRDSSNDKQIEDEWCSELGEIRKALELNGHQTAIEAETASGVTPIKICKPKVWMDGEVLQEEIDQQQAQETARKKFRSL